MWKSQLFLTELQFMTIEWMRKIEYHCYDVIVKIITGKILSWIRKCVGENSHGNWWFTYSYILFPKYFIIIKDKIVSLKRRILARTTLEIKVNFIRTHISIICKVRHDIQCHALEKGTSPQWFLPNNFSQIMRKYHTFPN